MEALRAELALDSAFATASPHVLNEDIPPHAPDLDAEAGTASCEHDVDMAAPHEAPA